MDKFQVRVSYVEAGECHRLVLPAIDMEPEQIVEKLRARFPKRHFYCWCRSSNGSCHCAAKHPAPEEELAASELRATSRSTPVSQTMSSPAVTVGLDEGMTDILALMAERGFRHVPVVRGSGELAGIVSDREILRRLSPFVGKGCEREAEADTLKLKAHQVMTRGVATISKDAPLAAASSLMKEMGVHCLPVMDGEELAGVVTATDLIAAFCGR